MKIEKHGKIGQLYFENLLSNDQNTISSHVSVQQHISESVKQTHGSLFLVLMCNKRSPLIKNNQHIQQRIEVSCNQNLKALHLAENALQLAKNTENFMNVLIQDLISKNIKASTN